MTQVKKWIFSWFFTVEALLKVLMDRRHSLDIFTWTVNMVLRAWAQPTRVHFSASNQQLKTESRMNWRWAGPRRAGCSGQATHDTLMVSVSASRRVSCLTIKLLEIRSRVRVRRKSCNKMSERGKNSTWFFEFICSNFMRCSSPLSQAYLAVPAQKVQ